MYVISSCLIVIICLDGGVDDVPSANWLLDFWGNKTVEGILMMPAARHQVVHLNESFKAKRKSGGIWGD